MCSKQIQQYFMDELLKGSISKSNHKELNYDDIATYIDAEENLSFLSDIVPKRVTFSKITNKINHEINQLPITNDLNQSNDNKMDQDKQ